MPTKRWSFLDTINSCLFIYVLLFVVDFKHQFGFSLIIVLVFAVWIITVIARNIYLNKKQKQQSNITPK